MSGFDRASEIDLLGREPFTKQILNALVTDNKATELVIGLAGEWGSGKSSVLLQIDKSLRNKKVEVFSFSPWMISDTQSLIGVFLAGLMSATGEKPSVSKEKLEKLAKFVKPAANIIVPGTGGVVSAITDIFLDNSLEETYQKYWESFNSSKKPIIVIIDELDRLMNDEIVTLFRMIKAIGDLPNVSYLLAYDKKRVSRALAGGGESVEGAAFLEKIIQLEFNLPYLQTSRANAFLIEQIKKITCDEINPVSDENRERFYYFLPLVVPQFLRTPRDVKRVVNVWFAKWNYLKNDVDWLDLLGFCILEIKAPDYVDSIRDDPPLIAKDGYASSHTNSRMMRMLDLNRGIDWMAEFDQRPEVSGDERKDKKRPSDIFKKDVEGLMRFLFPHYMQTGEVLGDRPSVAIENLVTLLTVLTYGAPDQTFLFSQIENFSRASLSEQRSNIKLWYDQRDLGNFIDRLSETYIDIPINDHNGFWRNVIFSIEKLSNEGRRLENWELYEGIGETLFLLLKKLQSRHFSASQLLDDCIGDQSLNIIAFTLFRSGYVLNDGGNEGLGDALLTKKEFDKLLMKFQAAFIEKFCPKNGKNFDDVRSIYGLYCFVEWPIETDHNSAIKNTVSDESSLKHIIFGLFRDGNRLSVEKFTNLVDEGSFCEHVTRNSERYGIDKNNIDEADYARPYNMAMRRCVRHCFPELYDELTG